MLIQSVVVKDVLLAATTVLFLQKIFMTHLFSIFTIVMLLLFLSMNNIVTPYIHLHIPLWTWPEPSCTHHAPSLWMHVKMASTSSESVKLRLRKRIINTHHQCTTFKFRPTLSSLYTLLQTVNTDRIEPSLSPIKCKPMNEYPLSEHKGKGQRKHT